MAKFVDILPEKNYSEKILTINSNVWVFLWIVQSLWCHLWKWYGKTRVTSCELRVKSLKARVESLKARVEIQKYELKSTSYKFKSMSYVFKSTSYKFKSTSCEFKSTSYEFKSTRSRIIKSIKTQVNSLLKQPSKTHKIISPKL